MAKKTKSKKSEKESDKKFKILATSDVHGDPGLINKLVDTAKKEDVDLVLLCGDFSVGGKVPENFIKNFVDIGKKVFFVTGNHEDELIGDFLPEIYPVKNLHGYTAVYDEVALFGCGGANIGPSNILEEDEILETLKVGHQKVKDISKKIMVTHVHPSKSKMEKFTPLFDGSIGLTKAVYELQPDILICGHVHEASGIEEKMGNTKVINVSKIPKIIEL